MNCIDAALASIGADPQFVAIAKDLQLLEGSWGLELGLGSDGSIRFNCLPRAAQGLSLPPTTVAAWPALHQWAIETIRQTDRVAIGVKYTPSAPPTLELYRFVRQGSKAIESFSSQGACAQYFVVDDLPIFRHIRKELPAEAAVTELAKVQRDMGPIHRWYLIVRPATMPVHSLLLRAAGPAIRRKMATIDAGANLRVESDYIILSAGPGYRGLYVSVL